MSLTKLGKMIFKRKTEAVKINKNSGQQLYVAVMFLSFLAATVISSIINVAMFGQLSPLFYEKLLFIAISITLEGTKIFTVIKANILSSIGKKIDLSKENDSGLSKGKKKTNSVTKASRKFFCLYLVFAFIAIFASLGLSLTITGRNSVESDSGIAKIALTLKTAKDENDYYSNQIVTANYTKYYTEWEDANNKYDLFNEELATLNKAYRDSDYKDSSILSQITEKKALQKALDLTNRKARRDEAKEITLKNEGLIEANNLIIKENSQLKLDLELTQSEEKGTSNMFKLLSELFVVIPEAVIRFIILMLVAVLIEMTIVTTAPEINISRKLLYYFRNYLPDDLDIDKLLVEFDKDLERFLSSDTVQSPTEEPKKTEEVIEDTPIVSVQTSGIPEVVTEDSPVKELRVKEHVEPSTPWSRPVTKEIPEVSYTLVEEIDQKFNIPEVLKETPPEVESSLVQVKEPVEVPIVEELPVEVPTVEELPVEELPVEVPVEELPVEPVKSSIEVLTENIEKGNSVLEDSIAKGKLDTSNIDSTTKKLIGKMDSSVEKKSVLPRRVVKKEKPVVSISEEVVKLEVSLPKEEVVPTVVEEASIPSEEVLEKIVQAPVEVEAKVSKVDVVTLSYKFGKTSENIKNLLVSYIKAMMYGLTDESVYPSPIRDPIEVAKWLGINDRVRDILLGRLKDMKYNDVPLIKEIDNGTYVTNFNPVFIEEYMTEVRKIHDRG